MTNDKKHTEDKSGISQQDKEKKDLGEHIKYPNWDKNNINDVNDARKAGVELT